MKNMLRYIILLLVCGVFGDTEVKTETVMEGDSLTLHTDLTDKQTDDEIRWRFGEAGSLNLIVQMSGNKVIYVEYVDGRFRDRLQISDTQTGSLTITNMRLKHSGLYEVEISTGRGTTYKKFRVTVKEVITVSVGESVTLQTDVKIQPDAVIQWKFEGDIIADLTGPVRDGFTNSEVNNQTGDLIIKDITRDQSGDYELKIDSSRGLISHRRFSVTVREVITVSEGESVTLQTDVNLQTHAVIQWKFEGDIIADLNGPVHDGFRNSEVNKQTGDLNITHIRGDQSGDYEMKINSRGLILHRRFSVTVREVITVSVSVMEGESVTLHTDVKIQPDAVIEWMFNGIIIADLTGRVHERFRNSEVNNQTGDLIITDIRGDQSGDYELRIKGSRGLISHRRFSVTVREQEKSSGLSPGAVAGICVVVFAAGAVVGAVGRFLYRRGKRQEPHNNGEIKNANEEVALQD